jgi:flagellar biosynthetic protein FliR
MPPQIAPILDHAGPFLMCLFRLSGLFVFAPVLGSPAIPIRIRSLLCIVFAVALYPTVPAPYQTPVEMDLFSLGWAVASEALIGITIGLLAALPMYAIQLGGLIIGHQVGIGLATVYNPALDMEGDVIGQFLLYLAMAVFVAVGGIEITFSALATTFTNVPLGGLAPAEAPLELLVGLVSSGMTVGLRVAAPVLCIVLAETIASGFIMKTMPQLNIMTIGFAVKVVIAMTALIGSIQAIEMLAREDVLQTLNALIDWSHSAQGGS